MYLMQKKSDEIHPTFYFDAISIKFSRREITVVMPTPPGTGVTYFATSRTFSVSTSPIILPSILFIPTSITTVSYTHLRAHET